MYPLRHAIAALLVASPLVAQSPDTTRQWGAWLSVTPPVNGFIGGSIAIQRGRWFIALPSMLSGHLNPRSYGRSPMPTHEERSVGGIQLGRVFRTGRLALRTQGGFATLSLRTVRDSVIPMTREGRTISYHFISREAGDRGRAVTGTIGADLVIASFFWIGAEASGALSTVGSLGGGGVVIGLGRRR